MSLAGEDMDIKLKLLEDITDNFSEKQKVGSGGYGNVYRAVYNGEEVAVKKLYQLHGLDDKVFDNEFRNLRNIHHENVVRLLGYCYELRYKFVKYNGNLVRAQEMERALCFEYMQGRSLDKHISDKSCDLDWPTCYTIIKGICEGLNHLHSAHGGPIFHLDLKPANILLDKNMTAKIGELGLSRLVTSSQIHKTETRTGTQAYTPPEYMDDGSISKKFDVFSLGVIIMKIVDGNEAYSHYKNSKLPHKQLTNLTEGSIAFNIKTNRTKYYTEPSKGIMPPCSKRYVLVTLPAQEEVPPSNMQCQDVFLVQSVHVGKELTSDDDITGDLFEKVMKDKVVDVLKLPIVFVARDQFTH